MRLVPPCFLSLLVAVSPAFAADLLYVHYREAKMAAKPSLLAPRVMVVRYGAALEVLGEEGSWYKVREPKSRAVGYVHAVATTPRRVVLKSNRAVDVRADAGDVVLAGKGFNPEVERQLAATNPKLNFKGVDEMERLRVSDAELTAFIKAGKLGGKG